MTDNTNPVCKAEALSRIIQGGMGFYISTWFLARTVAYLGGLGTVSGVALERVLAIILQRGDPGGLMRKTLAEFPYPDFAKLVIDTYYIEEGNPHGKRPNGIPFFTLKPSKLLIALTVCANFVFIRLAKQGHPYPISVNFLEKIAMPHVFAITGAMLAGVDYITMGAGIPDKIPAVINAILNGDEAVYPIPFDESSRIEYMRFDPKAFFGSSLPPMKKPRFLPIIASNILGEVLARKLGKQDMFGFVVEGPTAGGHNAPPRGAVKKLDELGNLIYGERDVVDFKKLARLGFPYWIAGSVASPQGLSDAILRDGACGIQVGTAFAMCEESGMKDSIKRELRRDAYFGKAVVKTDPIASPTGYPFKVLQMEGTVSDEEVYLERVRNCSQGSLRTLYSKEDGKILYRCPSEPVEDYLRKGGCIEDTIGRKCVCNGLFSEAGFDTVGEPPIITIGDDVNRVARALMLGPDSSYSAQDVFEYLGEKAL